MSYKMKLFYNLILSLLLSVCLIFGIFIAFPGVVYADSITDMESVKASGENFVTKDQLILTGNLRVPGANYGISYADGKFMTSYTNVWERTNILFSNAALDQSEVNVNGNYVATNTVRTYLSAVFNYVSAPEYQSIGMMFGKRKTGNVTTYYSLQVEVGRGFVGVYSFNVDANGNTVSEAGGPLSYTPGTFAPNTDYKIEILLDPERGITAYVGGTVFAENMATVYESNDSMLGLTPVIGLYLSSVEGSISNFELIYENGIYVPKDIWTMEYAREYDSANLVEIANVTVGENLHRNGNHGIRYDNGTFTSSTTNTWERAFFALHNDYLDTESIVKNGVVSSSSTAMYYSSAVLNWSSAGEYQNFGLFFGKLKKATVITYYGFLLEPGRGIAGVYTLDVDENGNPVAERSGPLSYNFGTYSANTDYKVELLMKPTGLTVYIGGQLIVRNITSVYESNDTLLGLTPVIGLNYCSVTGTVSNFVFKYLDGATPYIDYNAARRSAAENVVNKDSVSVSGNLFGENDYGIYFENGKFYSEKSDNGGVAAFILTNEYLSAAYVKVGGQDVSTDKVAVYTATNLKYYEFSANSSLGIMVGKKTIENGTKYMAFTISPSDGKAYLVTFDVVNGVFNENSMEREEVAGSLIFETEVAFTVETIIYPNLGFSVYLDGVEIVNNYETETAGITSVIGYFWQDVNATASRFVFKYLGIDTFETEKEAEIEEKYPVDETKPVYNTETIIPDVNNAGGCSAAVNGDELAVLALICILLCLCKSYFFKKETTK